MKLLQLSFLLLLGYGNLFSQKTQTPSWSVENSKNISFIENKGQFNGRNWRSDDKIVYGYNQNPFYIFFTKKGITYRFDKMIRTPEREKYDVSKPKRTNISELIFVDWVGSNKNVEIIAEDKTEDYHSYAMIDPITMEDYSINYINGYKKITYKNLYDNIDVEYIIHPSGGVKYNVILHPNADLSLVKLKYSSAKTSTSKDEFIDFKLNSEGQVEINTSLGTILEHVPLTFYNESKSQIQSNYIFENNTLSFNLGDYNKNETIVIDPWIISPTYTTSTAAWEVETDAVGNVYSIGGETPMQLKKYSSAGAPQWTYTTPWDTSNVWLGTLATDNNGDSYVTSGVTANMHKVNNAGAMVWSTNLNGVQQLQWNSEWWSITFNCDKTRLIVGGTWADGIFPSGFYPGVYEISMATGAVISDQILDNTPQGFGATPVEVRSISSSVDGRYIFLTHNDVGAIDQNQTLCGVEETIFLYDNQYHLGYKCENYLPATQNGGGLKALIANNTYFYTHTGNQIHRWNLTTGVLINSVTLTGGTSNTIPFVGGIEVHNSGLAVDNCGNIYAGSGDRVVKFNPNLTVNSSATTTFRVYDVSVNANGEVIACGAQQNNSATNRNGRIESLNLIACVQYSSICCDATICVPANACLADAPFTLVTATSGGTFSGTGVNPTTGLFSPSVAGVGTHTITYTLPCGSESITVVVNACSVLIVCEEANGDFTVTGGNPVYTWQNWQTYSYSSNDCVACGGILFLGFCTGATLPCSLTTTGWVTFGNGTTITPPVGATSIQLTDGSGTILLINPATVPACVSVPCPTITLSTTSQTNVLCNGASTGAATVEATGGNGTYTYTWNPGNLNGPTRTSLAAGTYTISIVDGNGCPGTGTVTITQPAALAAPTASVTAQPTCIISTGTITVTVPAPAAGTTYTLTGTVPIVAAQTNATGIFSGLAPGSYSIMASVNGCNTPLSSLIVNAVPANPAPPAASVTAQPTCVLSTGTITVTVPAPAAGTTYTVTGTAPVVAAQTNATGIFSGLAPGNYSVITTVNGCISTGTSLTVNAVPANPAAPTASVTAQPTCVLATGTITVTVPAPAAGTSYTVTGTAPVVAAQTNATGIFSGLAPGTYSVITTVNGCISTGTSLTVNAVPANPAAPTASVTAQPTCVLATGTITVTVPAPAAGTTYTVTGTAPVVASQTNATGIFSGLASGNYTVTITVGGCTSATTPLTINAAAGAPAAPTATITQPTCAIATGDVTVLTPTPAAGTTYTLTGIAPVVAAQTNATGIFSGLAAGNYTVITTVGGCNSTTTSLTVNAQPPTPAAPTASVSTQPTCVLATGTITVTVPTPAAGTSYTVTGTAPVVAAQSNATGVFNGLAAGNYTVTTTVGGCTSSTTSLTVNAQPATPAAPTASVTTQPTCVIPTGTITVTVPAPAAGTSYTVTGTAPIVAAQSNATGVFNGLAAGNYTVTTTVGGCTSTTTSLTINAAAGAPAAPTATITQPTCGTATGIITVITPVPAAGITYTLAGISPVVAAQTNATGIFINLASGDYAVIVTVAGCNSTPTSLTINTQPPTPSAPTASATQPTCVVETGTITVTVPAPAAGTTYTVTGTAPVVAAQTNSTGVFTGLATGNYSVITTVGGCTSAATLLTINPQPANPTAPAASVTALPTCAVPTGTITVTVPAPAAGTTYTLTGTSPVVAAQTNATGVFTGLTVGTYDVITTVGGCTSTASVIVISTPAGAPTISLTSSTDVTCFNDNDGTAVVSGSGGTGGLTYSWLPSGGSSASASGLTAGNYTATVTDGVGCSNSLIVTIGGPAQIVITETVTDIICGSTIGQIATAVSGGDGTYIYAWTPNGETTSSISNLTAGNYSLTVTDGNGCALTESYSVVATGSLSIVATPVSTTIQQGESVQLNATGGTTYTWTPSNGLNFTDIADPIATPNTTTIYTVTATDASGCTGTDNVTIVIQIICGEVFVPTVFSPNGSGPGVNNTQCVYGTCIVELNYAIFNRWGEKVFETTDPLVCWDGTYKGKAMNSGVFAYKLVATLIDGTSIEESGNLTLIR